MNEAEKRSSVSETTEESEESLKTLSFSVAIDCSHRKNLNRNRQPSRKYDKYDMTYTVMMSVSFLTVTSAFLADSDRGDDVSDLNNYTDAIFCKDAVH